MMETINRKTLSINESLDAPRQAAGRCVEEVLNIHIILRNGPVTVAERSEACTVFARSEAGIVDSNPTQGMDVCVCAFFLVCVVLCLGRGLATS
jgi:hypothetical protein